MQKWEYCVLGIPQGDLLSLDRPNSDAWILRYTQKGQDVTKVPKDALAQTIWQLGEEGWELLGSPVLYHLCFKRPKE